MPVRIGNRGYPPVLSDAQKGVMADLLNDPGWGKLAPDQPQNTLDQPGYQNLPYVAGGPQPQMQRGPYIAGGPQPQMQTLPYVQPPPSKRRFQIGNRIYEID